MRKYQEAFLLIIGTLCAISIIFFIINNERNNRKKFITVINEFNKSEINARIGEPLKCFNDIENLVNFLKNKGYRISDEEFPIFKKCDVYILGFSSEAIVIFYDGHNKKIILKIFYT
ncbi:hypothetical protein [Armatimonas sp.]|uniref:hypothetical protein n=1 Tax=Armatimonas sp. TaxID=1872638 RepID=UPI003751B489